jgi:hypothetical protein
MNQKKTTNILIVEDEKIVARDIQMFVVFFWFILKVLALKDFLLHTINWWIV